MKSFILLSFIFMSSSYAESGFIRKMMGDVLIDGKMVAVNDKVMEGQTVEAKGPKSIVIIKFDSGSQIVLRDGAMKIEASIKKEDSVISLVKGVFASHYIKKGKATQTVKTAKAVMGIRGTKFYIEEKSDSTYLCVCDGKVEISADNMSEMIGKNEDATVMTGKKLEKAKANQMMVDMALALVKELE